MFFHSRVEEEGKDFSLPNIEVWESRLYDCSCPRCSTGVVSENYATASDAQPCPSCGQSAGVHFTPAVPFDKGWFYWFCLPGCLPDSEECGPFRSVEAALKDAREE